MLPDHTIITKHQVYETEDTDAIWKEQEEKCEILGIDTGYFANPVLCHFFNSPFFNEKTGYWTVYDAIQCLAIKDGVDLVQFDNGNLGFVAYYNGKQNGFEILSR